MTTPKDPLLAAMQRRGLLPPDPPSWRQRTMDWIKAENLARESRTTIEPDTTAADAIDILGPMEQAPVPGLNDARVLQAAAEAQGLGRQRSLVETLRAALGQKDPKKIQHPPRVN